MIPILYGFLSRSALVLLVTAVPPEPVLPDGLQAILRQSRRFSEAIRQKSKQPLLLIQVRTFSDSQKGGKKPHFAETVHFKYEGGITVRSTVDLQKKKVIKVERLEAYPTPLIKKEEERAIRLARAQIPVVEGLYGNKKNKVRAQVLVPIVSDRKHRLFGHRLVRITFRPQRFSSNSLTVRVDLTEDKAILLKE